MARMTAEQKAAQKAATEAFVQAQGVDPAKLKKIVDMILAILSLFKS